MIGYYVYVEIFRSYSDPDPLFYPAGHYQYLRIQYRHEWRSQEISFRTLPYWQINEMLGLGENEYHSMTGQMDQYEMKKRPIWSGYKLVKEFILPINGWLTPVTNDPFDGRMPAPQSELITEEQKAILKEAAMFIPACFCCELSQNCSEAPFISIFGNICDLLHHLSGINDTIYMDMDNHEYNLHFIKALQKIPKANIKYVIGLMEDGLIAKWEYLSDFIRHLLDGSWDSMKHL